MTDEYFLEIEAHFAARRGTPFILSAKDWALMRKWADDSIPLPVVIEAIDSVFEKNESSGRKKIISSLSYCRHAVKELWDARRDLYVGSSDVPPEAAPEARLAELAARLPEPFASRVRDLARERSVPRIEQMLMDIEQEMITTLVDDSIRAELAAIDTSKLDAKIRARTEEANLRRLVRERFGFPRLTLFG
ncbi:MAG TPA: hypothetical protein VI391_00685 [Thermoanaerobaculia bacterium]